MRLSSSGPASFPANIERSDDLTLCFSCVIIILKISLKPTRCVVDDAVWLSSPTIFMSPFLSQRCCGHLCQAMHDSRSSQASAHWQMITDFGQHDWPWKPCGTAKSLWSLLSGIVETRSRADSADRRFMRSLLHAPAAAPAQCWAMACNT